MFDPSGINSDTKLRFDNVPRQRKCHLINGVLVFLRIARPAIGSNIFQPDKFRLWDATLKPVVQSH
jgi:hypothetical protein